MATVGIAPWAIACIVESYFLAVLAAAICFVYTLLLILQLWSLRAELLDESFDAIQSAASHSDGCAAAPTTEKTMQYL